MKSALLLVGLLLVCACGKNDGPSDPAAPRTSNETPESDLPRPGLYAVHMTPEIIGNAPPVPIPQESQQACYTPLRMERPDAFFLADAQSCRREEYRVGNGEVFARMSCDVDGVPVPFELRGSYDRDRAELVGDMIYADGVARTTRRLTRVGDC